jgi:hypothetical protein
MPSPYLSKSDFKACCDCRTKLLFRKRGYATNLDENEYLNGARRAEAARPRW